MAKKQITSQDVADLAGVSRTTVSLVLNQVNGFTIPPQTRRKVHEAAESLGYIPNAAAQALVSRRTRALGLVMTRSPHHISSDGFLPRIIAGLMDVIKEHNLRLLIEYVEVAHQDQAYLELARAKRIDGMLLLTPRIDDAGLRKLEQVDIPTVMMGQLAGTNLYSVDIDNRSAAQKGVQHLVQLGHRQIACITNAPLSYSAAADRVQGYKDALMAAGITPNDELIRYADFDPQSGYIQLKSLLAQKQKFTAIFVASDNVAMGACAALREEGIKIPSEMSIVGFDDLPWAEYCDPPLTTVRLDAQELARKACFVLTDLLEGKEVPLKRQILDTELVIRKSCVSPN